MEHRIVADTDVVIDFFAGRPGYAEAVAELLKNRRLDVTAVTAFELYAGVKGSNRLRQLESFFSLVPVLPLGLLESARAGRIFTELKASGITVGNQDILIAAICRANGRPLLTRNTSHFTAIEGLKLVSLASLSGIPG